jgi:hypothetical protein
MFHVQQTKRRTAAAWGDEWQSGVAIVGSLAPDMAAVFCVGTSQQF